MASSSRRNLQKGKQKMEMEAIPMDCFPDDILNMIVMKSNLQEVIVLRAVNKKFYKFASAQSTLTDKFTPRMMEAGMRIAPDGSQEFDVRALFSRISAQWAMVRILDPHKTLSLFFDRPPKLLLDLLEEEVFIDSYNTKALSMNKAGHICLAVAAYHPCLRIDGEPQCFEDGVITLPHWIQSSRVTDSRFEKSAHFWVGYEPHITGRFRVKLPPGSYSFSWVWRFQEEVIDRRDLVNDEDWVDGEPLICITSMVSDGEFHYNWVLTYTEGPGWEMNFTTPNRVFGKMSGEKQLLMASAVASAMRPRNLKVQSGEFMAHKIGQFWVDQANPTDYNSFKPTVFKFEMKDQNRAVGIQGLYFDGFLIRRLR